MSEAGMRIMREGQKDSPLGDTIMVRTEDLETMLDLLRSSPGFHKPQLAAFARLQEAINEAPDNLVMMIDFNMVQDATKSPFLLPNQCRAVLEEVRNDSYISQQQLENKAENLFGEEE